VQMPGKSLAYTYDGAGNRASQTETSNSAKTYGTSTVYNIAVTNYTYSSANELEKSVEVLYNENVEKVKRETLYEYDN